MPTPNSGAETTSPYRPNRHCRARSPTPTPPKPSPRRRPRPSPSRDRSFPSSSLPLRRRRSGQHRAIVLRQLQPPNRRLASDKLSTPLPRRRTPHLLPPVALRAIAPTMPPVFGRSTADPSSIFPANSPPPPRPVNMLPPRHRYKALPGADPDPRPTGIQPFPPRRGSRLRLVRWHRRRYPARRSFKHAAPARTREFPPQPSRALHLRRPRSGAAHPTLKSRLALLAERACREPHRPRPASTSAGRPRLQAGAPLRLQSLAPPR